MNKQIALLLGLVLISSILLIGVTSVNAKSSEQKAITKVLGKIGYKNICKLGVTTKTNNQTQMIYDNTKCNVVVPPPVVCPTGQHVENGVCVKDSPVPIPPTPSVIPSLNKTITFRFAVVGDVDNNGGLDTQLNLAKKYESQAFVLPGDFGYSNGKAVISKLDSAFGNRVVAVGNHDSCSDVKTSVGKCYGDFFLGNNHEIAFFTIDANSGFGCSGTQFNDLKTQIEGSDAFVNIAVVHQPFLTVKSDHGPNGAFDCYQSLFKANGVKLVLQAHNHNYQYGLVDGISYGVFGTGTHDTGSSMYKCGSSSFNNGVSAKCITGTNGITLIDINYNTKKMDGYFVSNSDKLVSSFSN